MSDRSYIWDEVDRYERGMALHYPLLYAAVIGLEAKRVVEFGAGISSRVILDALAVTGGDLFSFSTDGKAEIAARYRIPVRKAWYHRVGLTAGLWGSEWTFGVDLVLHDGAHDFETVQRDLLWVEPAVKRFGLILIHDSLHSVHGSAIQRAIVTGLRGAYSEVTLPYGYGLTILRRETPNEFGEITTARSKVGSTHVTIV